jgi:hypothetical protein
MQETSMKQFVRGLFFDPEDAGEIFLRNVGWLSTDYMAFISEDRTLYNHRCENLRSYTGLCILIISVLKYTFICLFVSFSPFTFE